MAGLNEDFGKLKAEFEKLLGSLSTSVHDATKLTLEHTTLYDSAVGELQVMASLMHMHIVRQSSAMFPRLCSAPL